MRRTLSIVFVFVLLAAVVTTSEASWLSELIFGRHREFTAAGITYAVDEMVPASWVNDPALSARYWKPGAPVFAGTVLRIGVLITTGDPQGRRFAICITDPNCVVGNFSGQADFRSDLNRHSNGGLKILGTFAGKYGLVELDTCNMKPGTYFLYTYANKDRKAWRFSEEAMVIQIAPPLPDMIRALRDEPEEVLRAWGLESYPTLSESMGGSNLSSCEFDLSFADGCWMRDVSISGQPAPGRTLGIFNQDTLVSVVKIDRYESGVAYSSSSSAFLQSYRGRESELRVDWVVRSEMSMQVAARDVESAPWRNYPVKTTIFVEPDDIVRQGKIPWLNNYNFVAYSRRSRGTGDQVDFVRRGNFAREIRVGQNGHMEVIKCGNLVYMLEVEVEQNIKIGNAQSDCYVYVPERKADKVRCIRLAPSGIPLVAINQPVVSREFTPGLWNGLAYIIGQRVHRPDRVNVSAHAPTNNINNNSNANTNVNTNGNTINVGDGSATGSTSGSGSSTATSDP